MSDPVRAVTPTVLRIPFDDGGRGAGITPTRWSHLDIVLVRVETASGLVGWGEAFGYMCQHATACAVRDLVAPAVLGLDSREPAAVALAAQKALALFGRYGVTMFAISGLDIALWDIAGKRAGLSLARLLGGRRRASARAYASLVRYGDPALVERFAARAGAQGHDEIKLHEVETATIAAGRRGAPSARLTVDVNCQWSLDQARAMLPVLRDNAVDWLEEPTFPPEDPAPWRALAGQGVAIAAGENACTAVEFARLVPALDVVQPSVTKVGGVSEFLKVRDLAGAAGRRLAAHSPYFGPGYWASLQLAALEDDSAEAFEYLYVEAQADCGLDLPRPVAGRIAVPDAPGIGFEPDPRVVSRYAV